MLKKLMKIVAFILLAGLIFLGFIKVLCFKSPDGIDQMYAFYQNEPETVDVLFLGSSHMYTNINTGLLWEQYGISSYDLGGADQPFWNTYYNLQEALKTQTPKLLVVEIYSAAVQKGHFQGIWTIENSYGMKFNENFFKAVKAGIQEDEQQDYFNRFARYHSRYSMVTREDFDYESRLNCYKGYEPKFGTLAQEPEDVSKVTDLSPPNEKMADYMMKMIDLAKEKEIPILLVCAPYAIKEDEQKIFNCFYAYADENSVPYIDFNVINDEVEIDFSQDMYDWSHLNERGSAKYTLFLGKYIKDNYELQDHRGDKKYSSWDDNARVLDCKLRANQLRQISDLKDYLGLIEDENYIIMVSARNINDVSVLSTEMLNKLSSLGMDKGSLLNEGNFFIRNCITEYYSSDKNYKWISEDDTHDFYMERVYIEHIEDGSGAIVQNDSKIVIDGVDYFQENTMLNIITFDRTLGQVIDAVSVDIGDGEVKLERMQMAKDSQN